MPWKYIDLTERSDSLIDAGCRQDGEAEDDRRRAAAHGSHFWKASYMTRRESRERNVAADAGGICKPVRTLQQEATARYVISWPRVPIVFVQIEHERASGTH